MRVDRPLRDTNKNRDKERKEDPSLIRRSRKTNINVIKTRTSNSALKIFVIPEVPLRIKENKRNNRKKLILNTKIFLLI